MNASPTRSPAVVAIGLALGLVALLAGMLSLFAWPAATATPRQLPVVVAGPPAAAGQVGAALEQAQPGAFLVSAVPTRDAAAAAVRDQQAYGALVVGASGAEVLIASARSPVVAQLLSQVGARLASTRQLPLTTTDLVPLPATDPRGAGLVAGLLPIVLGGLACAAAGTALLARRRWRVVAAALFAVVGGVVLTVLLQSWLGSLQGSLVANAGVLILGIAAVSFSVLGLESLLGPAGLALGAGAHMLFGNALSAASSAPEMLPAGWGSLGQLLPPGAVNTAVRSVAFFDGSGAARPIVVLAVWAVVGLALTLVPTRRRATMAHAAPARLVGAATAD